MKANEAPEKLYLSKNIYSTYMYQVPDPDDDTAVEYTRADAFIEKACEWIKEHKEVVETEDNGIIGWIPDYFIEDFKKYMEE